MKKLLMGLMIAILALAGCGAKESATAAPANRLEKIIADGKLTISTSPDYPPYEFMDPSKTGQEAIVGADIDFAKYIAEQLGVTLVIEAMSFDAALAAVQEGKVDLCISGLAYKEDRAKAMQLTDNYNLASYQGIMIPADKAAELKTAEDFSGLLIGAQNGSLQYENVEKQLPEAKIEVVASLSDGILMLQSGKVDALAMSGTSGEQYAKNYSDIAMSEFRFEMTNTGTCVGVMNGEKELFDKVNEIIKVVNEQGLYSQWQEAALELSSAISAK